MTRAATIVVLVGLVLVSCDGADDVTTTVGENTPTSTATVTTSTDCQPPPQRVPRLRRRQTSYSQAGLL